MIHIILLSGGSGSRLWPLSNQARSKQFLKLLPSDEQGHVSMVQRTFSNIKSAHLDADITITAPTFQESMIKSQLESDYSLVLEPFRRDTAAAIMLACKHLELNKKAESNDTVIVAPIDSAVEVSYFEQFKKLDDVVQEGAANLVLLGTKPTYPSEKYGYILVKDEIEKGVFSVTRFVEKPTLEEAESLISANALWNCGVFAFKLKYLNTLTDKYISSQIFDDYLLNYDQFPSISFDYEVVEKSDSIAVVTYEGEWKDLGTWNTLTEEMEDTVSGNITGIETCTNTHAINELNIPLITLGLENAVVVATHDGILVSDKHTSSYMKPYVEKASIARPMFEQRQWGEYRVLDSSLYEDEKDVLTKELFIKKGKQISYQKHNRRSETWIIASGSCEIVLDDVVNKHNVGDVVSIDVNTKHAINALEDVHIIEIQIGNDISEDDIERFGFFWDYQQ